MISKENIKITAEDFIADNPDRFNNKDVFIVEIKVSADNRINILLDSIDGVTVDDCIAVSRAVEHSRDREEEDFELTVSSYGIDRPLLVKKQYDKNINRMLNVETVNNKLFKGILVEVNDEAIVIEEKKKQKIKGRKKKEEIIIKTSILFQNIKKAKIVITF